MGYHETRERNLSTRVSRLAENLEMGKLNVQPNGPGEGVDAFACPLRASAPPKFITKRNIYTGCRSTILFYYLLLEGHVTAVRQHTFTMVRSQQIYTYKAGCLFVRGRDEHDRQNVEKDPVSELRSRSSTKSSGDLLNMRGISFFRR